MRRLKLLVVDDEPAFLRSLELVLDGVHDVVVSSRSPEALELVRQDPERFDVVLCDLSMPDVDGIAFHSEMEQLGIGPRFVIVTAGAFTERAEDFLRRVTCARISKPFTIDELSRLLESVA